MTKDRRSIILPALAGLALALAGCGGGGGTATVSGATLTGQVLVPDGRAPAAGLVGAGNAEVGLYPVVTDGDRPAALRTATANAQGYYTFAAVEPGNYEIRAICTVGGRTLEVATLATAATGETTTAECDPETTVAVEQIRDQLAGLAVSGIEPDEFPNLDGLFEDAVEDVRALVEDDPDARPDCGDPEAIRAAVQDLITRRAPTGHYIGQAIDAINDKTIYVAMVVDPNTGKLLIVGMSDDHEESGPGDGPGDEPPSSDEGPGLMIVGEVADDGRLFVEDDGLRIFGCVNADYGTGEWAETDDQGAVVGRGTWELRRCVQPNAGLWFGYVEDPQAAPEDVIWGLMIVPDQGEATLMGGSVMDFVESQGMAPLFERFALSGDATSFDHTGERADGTTFRLEGSFIGEDVVQGTVTAGGETQEWAMTQSPAGLEEAYRAFEQIVDALP